MPSYRTRARVTPAHQRGDHGRRLAQRERAQALVAPERAGDLVELGARVGQRARRLVRKAQPKAAARRAARREGGEACRDRRATTPNRGDPAPARMATHARLLDERELHVGTLLNNVCERVVRNHAMVCIEREALARNAKTPSCSPAKRPRLTGGDRHIPDFTCNDTKYSDEYASGTRVHLRRAFLDMLVLHLLTQPAKYISSLEPTDVPQLLALVDDPDFEVSEGAQLALHALKSAQTAVDRGGTTPSAPIVRPPSAVGL